MSNSSSGTWWIDDATALMSQCGLLEFDQLEDCIKNRNAHISGYRVFVTYAGTCIAHTLHIHPHSMAWSVIVGAVCVAGFILLRRCDKVYQTRLVRGALQLTHNRITATGNAVDLGQASRVALGRPALALVRNDTRSTLGQKLSLHQVVADSSAVHHRQAAHQIVRLGCPHLCARPAACSPVSAPNLHIRLRHTYERLVVLRATTSYTHHSAAHPLLSWQQR